MGAIDLDAYFGRIGYTGPREASLGLLGELHLAHPKAIPFEALDPLFGRPVRLDAASLEAKLVRSARGGYCFEQNGLLWRVLTGLGFEVTPLAARVRWGLPEDAPPTSLSHMLLKVATPEGERLFDVGFGGQSPTAPLRLEPDVEQPTPHAAYRLVRRPEDWDLQMRLPDRWATLYRFTTEPRVMADYEVANWFTAAHPTSRFVNNLIASRVVGDRRLNLFNTELTTHRPDGASETEILPDARAVHAALTGPFGLEADLADLERVWDRLPPPRPAAV